MRNGFEVHGDGKDLCLVATGFMVHTALEVAERMSANGICVGVVDLFGFTNFNEVALLATLQGYRGIVTMEEGFRGRGGLDAMMFNLVGARDNFPPILNIGVEGDYCFDLGTRIELHEKVGIGVSAVFSRISDFLDKISTRKSRVWKTS